jgi:hypothetical protein
MSKQKRPIEEVAPDDFLDTWGASTYEEAFERAEQAETTTPPEDRKRCPNADCLSQRVRRKPGYDDQHQNQTEYVCTTCRFHFDDPIVGEPDDADELIVADTSDGAEELVDSEADPFEWVAEDELEEPPISRQLAALDDRTLTALAIYLYAPWEDGGPSYRDLATIWPYSPDWIGDRVRAWKDGEHRDLVRDPRPRVSLAIDAEEVSAE